MAGDIVSEKPSTREELKSAEDALNVQLQKAQALLQSNDTKQYAEFEEKSGFLRYIEQLRQQLESKDFTPSAENYKKLTNELTRRVQRYGGYLDGRIALKKKKS